MNETNYTWAIGKLLEGKAVTRAVGSWSGKIVFMCNKQIIDIVKDKRSPYGKHVKGQIIVPAHPVTEKNAVVVPWVPDFLDFLADDYQLK